MNLNSFGNKTKLMLQHTAMDTMLCSTDTNYHNSDVPVPIGQLCFITEQIHKGIPMKETSLSSL